MDTISNFIIKVKNAGNAGLESVSVPFSKLKRSIAEVLKKEGFIKDFEEKADKGKPALFISLFPASPPASPNRGESLGGSENRAPKIKGVKRISKPSKRIYKKSSEIRSVKNGYGALILSTSSGVMTGRDAKKAKLGGEALFTIW